MTMKIVEGLFLIGFVGLILSNPTGFSSVVTGIGKTYAATVTGLQGR